MFYCQDVFYTIYFKYVGDEFEIPMEPLNLKETLSNILINYNERYRFILLIYSRSQKANSPDSQRFILNRSH